MPLGSGSVLDPFMGSGSTVAAATAIGYDAVGVELDDEYFEMATRAVPLLAAMQLNAEKAENLEEEDVEPMELFPFVESVDAQLGLARDKK